MDYGTRYNTTRNHVYCRRNGDRCIENAHLVISSMSDTLPISEVVTIPTTTTTMTSTVKDAESTTTHSVDNTNNTATEEESEAKSLFKPNAAVKTLRYVVECKTESQYNLVREYIVQTKFFAFLISVMEPDNFNGFKYVIYALFKRAVPMPKCKPFGATFKICKFVHESIYASLLAGKVVETIGTPPHVPKPVVLQDYRNITDPTILSSRQYAMWRRAMRTNTTQNSEEVNPKRETYYIYGGNEAIRNNWVRERIGSEEYDAIEFSKRVWKGISFDRETKIAWYYNYDDDKMDIGTLLQLVSKKSRQMVMAEVSIPNKFDTIYITTKRRPEHIYTEPEYKKEKEELYKIVHFICLDELKPCHMKVTLAVLSTDRVPDVEYTKFTPHTVPISNYTPLQPNTVSRDAENTKDENDEGWEDDHFSTFIN